MSLEDILQQYSTIEKNQYKLDNNIFPTQYITKNLNNTKEQNTYSLEHLVHSNSLYQNKNLIEPYEYIQSNFKNDISKSYISDKILESKIYKSEILESYSDLFKPDVQQYIKQFYPPKEKIFEDKTKRHTILETPQELELPQIPDHDSHELQAELEKRYGKLRLVGKETSGDIAQHGVEFLTFSIAGTNRVLRVASKEKSDYEMQIAQTLKQLGIPTYELLAQNDEQFIMSDLGSQTLRSILRAGDEAQMRAAYSNAVRTLAHLHVVATKHINEFTPQLLTHNVMHDFAQRFIKPHGYADAKLMQAYAHFVSDLQNDSFVHGDAHDGNFLQTGVIDFEWSGKGNSLLDVARLTNAVQARAETFDNQDILYQTAFTYTAHRNEVAYDQNMPRVGINVEQLKKAMVVDQLYKMGERLIFAKQQPALAQQKITQSAQAFTKAIDLLDDIDTTQAKNLRHHLIEYAVNVPYLHQIASYYKTYTNRLAI